MTIECNDLTVEAVRTNSDANAGKTADPSAQAQAIREIVARGNVVAISDGRTLRCEQANVFAPEKKIVLTGAPRVEAPGENATLDGDKIDIFWEDLPDGKRRLRDIDVLGTPARRVSATLPGIGSDTREKSALVGDRLTMICGANVTTFDVSGNVSMRAKDLSGSCDRMILFASPEMRGKSAAAIVRRIEAIGNVSLSEKSTKITGGKATLDVNPQVKEWLAEDDNGADGNSRVCIQVRPDEDAPAETRPRIYLPENTSGAAILSISQDKKNPAEKAKTDVPEIAPYIEGDSLEILAGEERTRFWLRDNVCLKTAEANGSCRTIEGLLLPEKTAGNVSGTQNSRRLEAEKIIGRGDVAIEHDGAEAHGKTLEIFPKRNIAVLSGDARFSDAQGMKFTPGESDKFVFDLARRELLTGAIPGARSEQVSRPKITIPRGSDRSFIIPPSRKK